MYLSSLFGLLNGWQNSVFKLNVTLKKSTDIIFVITVTDRPQSLNTLMMYFFFCSICGPEKLSNISSPSSQYNPILPLSMILLNLFKIY